MHPTTVTGFILIFIVALLLFGPSKLPELGRAFGRTLREFKNGAKELLPEADSMASLRETSQELVSLDELKPKETK